ncbi:MAG: HlyD family secretion protein [Aquabacterium sp.]|nr:HlyD family secretion protein [Aquabacterium sp.]
MNMSTSSTHPTEANPAGTPAAASPPPAARWRRFALLGTGPLVLVAAGVWLHGQLTHVVVDDARAAADIIAVSSRVAGRVTTVNVVAGDATQRTAVLASIDNRESALLVKELGARIEGIASRRAEIDARIALIDDQTESQAKAQSARLAATRATALAALAERDFAVSDFDRLSPLKNSRAISLQDWERARMAAEAARQKVSSTEYEVETAKAQLGVAQAARRELQVLQRQAVSLGPELRQLIAQRDRALIDLSDRVITMPFDGSIDQVFVHVGEYVTPGQRLLMLHDPKRVRIEANVKETDIRHFRPGQRVEITADAYPEQAFEGTVDRIGGAVTSEFALLPNPNPSGNFTKITQRLQVRIALTRSDERLRPGMMVEISARK